MIVIKMIAQIVVGIVLLVLSVPIMLVGVLLLIGGLEDKADYVFEHTPLWYWWDWLKTL